MRITLVNAPEGSPNFCFGVYRGRQSLEFIQSDWEYPSLAARFGWRGLCKCGRTDGTVDCEHKTASEMISAAYDWLMKNDGKTILTNGDYYESDAIFDSR